MNDKRGSRLGVATGSLAGVVLVGVGTTLILGTVLGFVFAGLAAGETGAGNWWNPWSYNLESSQLYDVVRSDVAALGLLGIGAAALVAYRRQHTNEEQHRIEQSRHLLETDADMRSRYASAAEQLGSESPAVRLAGVYAMAELADEWIRRGNLAQFQVAIDVLCAYLRMPSAGVSSNAEGQVRSSVVSVIRRHLLDPSEALTWCRADFDLRGADLADLDLRGVTFAGKLVTFAGATFSGEDTLFGTARFTGDRVTFDGARFVASTTSFRAAVFDASIVTFGSSVFEGLTTSFSRARFTGTRVEFDRASFRSRRTNFNGSEFHGRRLNLNRASFTDGPATFESAVFASPLVTFRGTNFASRASFAGARFQGERAFFDQSFFHNDLTFERAQFRGVNVSLRKSTFTGQLDVSGAHLDASHMNFKLSEFGPISIRFVGTTFLNGALVDFSRPARWLATVYGGSPSTLQLPAWAPSPP